MSRISQLRLFSVVIYLLIAASFVYNVQAKRSIREQTMKQEGSAEDDTPQYDQARLPLYLDRVKQNPLDPVSWSALAYVLRGEGGAASETVEIEGKKYSKMGCYVKALEINDKLAAVWYNVGAALGHDLDRDFITVKGKKHNKLDCYVRSVELEPKAGLPWYNIGTILNEQPERFKADGGAVRVKGIKTSQLQCYANALAHDNRIPFAWNNLGTSLKSNKDFVVIDGAKFSRKQCFIEELENNPTHSAAWMNLATSLETGRETAIVADIKYSKRACLLNAIRYNPLQAGAWHNLATILHPRDNVTVTIEGNAKAGTTRRTMIVNATRCEEEALRLDPRLAVAWFGAATKMKENETLFVPNSGGAGRGGSETGRRYTKKDAYLKAIELEPNWADPWNNLATVVTGKDERVRIDGFNRSFTQKELLIESINRDPEVARTWQNLCMVMTSADEKVTVDGGIYNKEECQAHADEVKATTNPRG